MLSENVLGLAKSLPKISNCDDPITRSLLDKSNLKIDDASCRTKIGQVPRILWNNGRSFEFTQETIPFAPLIQTFRWKKCYVFIGQQKRVCIEVTHHLWHERSVHLLTETGGETPDEPEKLFQSCSKTWNILEDSLTDGTRQKSG